MPTSANAAAEGLSAGPRGNRSAGQRGLADASTQPGGSAGAKVGMAVPPYAANSRPRRTRPTVLTEGVAESLHPTRPGRLRRASLQHRADAARPRSDGIPAPGEGCKRPASLGRPVGTGRPLAPRAAATRPFGRHAGCYVAGNAAKEAHMHAILWVGDAEGLGESPMARSALVEVVH